MKGAFPASLAIVCAGSACGATSSEPAASEPAPSDDAGTAVDAATDANVCGARMVLAPGYVDLCASATPFLDRVVFTRPLDYFSLRVLGAPVRVFAERGTLCATATDVAECRLRAATAIPTSGRGGFFLFTVGDDVRTIADATPLLVRGASIETDILASYPVVPCVDTRIWAARREPNGEAKWLAYDAAQGLADVFRNFRGQVNQGQARPDPSTCVLSPW